MQVVERPAPPSLRARLAIVAFAIAVGAIRDSLTQIGTLAYVAWMALALPGLAVLAVASGVQCPYRWGES